MNININSHSFFIVSSLKEKIFLSLTDKQKKTIMIASAALSCLAACYLIYRHYFTARFLKITYQDGRIAEGLFKNGLLNGKGKIIYPQRDIWDDEQIWEGEFKEGQLNGNGKIEIINENPFEDKKNQNVYEGEFKNNMLNGKGKKIIDGIIWEGEFKNNELIKGKKTDPNEKICEEGQFTNNKLHGQGQKIINTEEGDDITAGVFEEGHLKNGKKIISTYGRVLEEEFKTDLDEEGDETILLNGKGKISIIGRVEMEGTFKDGALHGTGREDDGKGSVWEGEYYEGLLHGQGKLIHHGKVLIEGRFDKGCVTKDCKSYNCRIINSTVFPNS